MKIGVPAFNYVLSIFYIALAGVALILLKLALRKQKQPALSSEAMEVKEEKTSIKMIAVSWFKKYTFASVFSQANWMYSLKECFILSIFAIACFGINKIILWPVTFSLFLVPISVLLL